MKGLKRAGIGALLCLIGRDTHIASTAIGLTLIAWGLITLWKNIGSTDPEKSPAIDKEPYYKPQEDDEVAYVDSKYIVVMRQGNPNFVVIRADSCKKIFAFFESYPATHLADDYIEELYNADNEEMPSKDERMKRNRFFLEDYILYADDDLFAVWEKYESINGIGIYEQQTYKLVDSIPLPDDSNLEIIDLKDIAFDSIRGLKK